MPTRSHIVAGGQRRHIVAVIDLAHGARQGHAGGAHPDIGRADVQCAVGKSDGVIAAGLPTGGDHVTAHVDRANGRPAVSERTTQNCSSFAINKAAVIDACSGRVSIGVIGLAVVFGLDQQRRCCDHPVCGAERVGRQLVVGCVGAAQADARDCESLGIARVCVDIGAHAIGPDRIGAHHTGQPKAQAAHAGRAVVDFAQARGDRWRQRLLFHRERTHNVHRVAVIGTGVGDAAGTHLVAACRHLARAAQTGGNRAQGQGGVAACAIAEGKGCCVDGSAAGQVHHRVAGAALVLDRTDGVAGRSAVGGAGIVQANQQLISRHDRVIARLVDQVVVVAGQCRARSTEHPGISASRAHAGVAACNGGRAAEHTGRLSCHKATVADPSEPVGIG